MNKTIDTIGTAIVWAAMITIAVALAYKFVRDVFGGADGFF